MKHNYLLSASINVNLISYLPQEKHPTKQTERERERNKCEINRKKNVVFFIINKKLKININYQKTT